MPLNEVDDRAGADLPDSVWQIAISEADSELTDEAKTFEGLVNAIKSTVESTQRGCAPCVHRPAAGVLEQRAPHSRV